MPRLHTLRFVYLGVTFMAVMSIAFVARLHMSQAGLAASSEEVPDSQNGLPTVIAVEVGNADDSTTLIDRPRQQSSNISSTVSLPSSEVQEWITRLERFLKLQRDEPHQNATTLAAVLEQVSASKTIRSLKPSTGGLLETNATWAEEQLEKQKHPSLSVQLAADCGTNGKWAVITSIAAKPTKTMEILIAQNWCVVVIGDSGSPANFAVPDDKRFVYLSLEDQLRLPFRIASLTPKKSFSRKNIGYLFAMSQGARVILDIDDDNEPIPIDNEGTYLPAETVYGLRVYDRPYLYKESLLYESADVPVWNPYPYFNLSHSWPRGYPWEYLPFQNTTELHMTMKKQECLPVIQQYMANLDPDVDAAYRMKFKLPMDYREGSFKRIVLPRNVFSPYNAQATVHLAKAFWSMMLPVTVDGRVADIWRSYIAQSLLHLVPEACLMFTSPAVQHVRNPHNYTSDFQKEMPLYSQAASMIQLIRNLPVIANDFVGAFLKVYEKLYETGVLESDDYEYAKAWLGDLQQIGVFLPEIPGNNTWMRQTRLCINFNDAAYAVHAAPEILFKYVPLFQNAIILLDNLTFPDAKTALANHNISEPLNSTILKFMEHWPEEIKAYICNSQKGFLQNRCLRKCLEHAEGKNIFYMADDDYYNFARAEETLKKDVIWFPEIAHINGTVYDETIFDNYTRWHYTYDLKRASRALKELPEDIKQAYIAHTQSTGEVEGHCLADCAYVPRKYHDKLMGVIDRIEQLQPDLFSEAGMPLALNLVAPGEEKYEFKPDFVVWGGPRYNTKTLEDLFPKAMHLHAVKISCPAPRAAWRDIMAKQYARLNFCGECHCCDVPGS